MHFLDRNYNLPEWKNAPENGTSDASITINDFNQNYGTQDLKKKQVMIFSFLSISLLFMRLKYLVLFV